MASIETKMKAQLSALSDDSTVELCVALNVCIKITLKNVCHTGWGVALIPQIHLILSLQSILSIKKCCHFLLDTTKGENFF